MEKKRIITMALLIATSLVILLLSPGQRNGYLESEYPEAEISEADFDESLNSEDCFAEHVYKVHEGTRELECYFIKSMGYKDFVHYVVEIDIRNERIERVRLIEDHETDDYGGYIREGWFLERFENMSLVHPTEIVKMRKENDYEIVAITGATITSLSASKAANLAMKIYLN